MFSLLLTFYIVVILMKLIQLNIEPKFYMSILSFSSLVGKKKMLAKKNISRILNITKKVVKNIMWLD